MASSCEIGSPEILLKEGSPELLLTKGFGHRSAFDVALISAAAHSLVEAGRGANCIVEVCCGFGDLLAAMGQVFPDAELTGIDQFVGTVEIARTRIEGISNAKVVVGDVMRMEQFDDASVDLIYGQASMHHLTHHLKAAFDEFHRVLRPGGKCIFTFEPLSHNHMVNAVRSYRNAKLLLTDESNLYLDTLEHYSDWFSKTAVQCFNLTPGYLIKVLPVNSLFLRVGSLFRNYELFRFRRNSRILRKAANFNVVFTK